jgi:hypothetical protein
MNALARQLVCLAFKLNAHRSSGLKGFLLELGKRAIPLSFDSLEYEDLRPVRPISEL